MKKFLAVTGLALALLLAACGQTRKEDGKLHLVTTFYPVYEFTKQITGDTANVDLLIGAGTEVHDFEPSAKNIATIQEADAFIYENENMETWAPKLVKELKTTKAIKATEGMILLPGTEEEDHDHEGEDHHHEYDPHVWLSPQRAIKMVESLRDQLSQAYPDQKATFEKNAAAYIKKLEDLNSKYETTLSQAQQKTFVTQHTAFAYLAFDYGLEQVSITGLKADSEPSAARLAELTDYIKQHQIKVIYFEENASKSLASTLSKEAGVELDVLNPLESLTDQEFKDGADYISVMEDNLKALEKTTSQAGGNIEAKPEVKTVASGYFEDKDIKDRELSDWKGDWKSVYPLLQDGSLDQVFDYKAKKSGSMTAAEYKDYYDKGYKTDVSDIKISDKTMTFVVKGQEKTHTYKYAGKKTLTYKKGNRGVRFMFEATDPDAGEFKYVQFSDHNIAPTKAAHFHIFWGGESQEKLWDQLENWPTYYPSNLSSFEIAQEMVAH